MSTKKGFWSSSNAHTVLLLVGIAIGAIVGLVLGPKAAALKPIGQIFINLLFTLVTPLVFFSIAGSVASMSDMKRLGKLLSTTIGLFAFTGLIAAGLTAFLVKVIDPCKGLVVASLPEATAPAPTTAGEFIVKMFTVNDFPLLLSKSNMLPFIVFTVFFGIAVSILGEKGKGISDGLNTVAEVIYKMVNILMKAAPVGLGAYFANLTGVYGPTLLGSMGSAVLFYYPLALGIFFILFPLYLYFAGGAQCIKAFYKNTFTASVTAFGTSSSAASIPVQRELCDKIGVPTDISGVVVPMGATMHMDGAAAAIIMRIYLASVLFNIQWSSFGDIALSVVVAILCGTAMSAVPGGGTIGSMLIMSIFGMPPEALGVLILFGSLIDPVGTMVNSSGDSVASCMVTRVLEGKDWMAKNLSGKQVVNW
jgi:Na+/H+-dicarboxylate symporter